MGLAGTLRFDNRGKWLITGLALPPQAKERKGCAEQLSLGSRSLPLVVGKYS